MPRTKSSFRVRHYELDFYNHVNNAVYLNYMQEAAIEASAAVGFGPDWYSVRGVGWVLRRLTIRYYLSVTYGDELDATTWVSEMRGVRCTREYLLTRAGDNATVARARAQWVYIDLKTGQPIRFPEDFIGAFAPGGEVEDIDVRLRHARQTEGAYRYRGRRRVQFHELDAARHVNHAHYLHWIGQAYFDALRIAGHPLDPNGQSELVVWQGGHDIEYFAPALDHDPIEIVSWVCEMAKVRGAWTHEILHAESQKLLARDYSLGIFVNPEGKPALPPPQVVEDVLRGPGQ